MRETKRISKTVGIIKNINTDLNVSQAKWDTIFHKQINCEGKNRPTGCLVCEHDVTKCNIINCALCQAKKGLLLNPKFKWTYPEN